MGIGYARPKPLPPEPEERPFYCLEPAFTSGEMVCRKYNKSQSSFKLESERSDPYHYPNDKNVKEQHHYGDFRRRQAQWDPTKRPSLPCDKELQDSVPEGMVTQFVQAHRGESRKYVPQHMLNILMDDNVRPTNQTDDLLSTELREPSKSAGPRQKVKTLDEVGVALGYPSEPETLGQVLSGAGRAGCDSWKWCLGGRKLTDFAAEAEENALATLRQSQSLPTLNAGASFLHGNLGRCASTFHGLHTRRYGHENAWDGRMRGGSEAKMGFAGTFPIKEVRPG